LKNLRKGDLLRNDIAIVSNNNSDKLYVHFYDKVFALKKLKTYAR